MKNIMRYVQIGVVVLFVMGMGLYGFSVYQQKKNTDTTIPVITSDMKTISVPCAYTEEQIMEGLHAFDEKDGDLTEEIMLGSLSRFQQPGHSKATYVVFDSANQSALLTRDVIFTDYHSPRFTLTQPLVFAIGSNENPASYVGAQDQLDGDISSLVRMVNRNVVFSVPGDYAMDVEVTNSFGDLAELTLPVHIIEPSELRLTIDLTQPLVYVARGSAFAPAEYLAGVQRMDGTQMSKNIVGISSNVDTSQPGCYEVKYTAQSKAGDRGVTWLTVVVE